MRKMRNVRKEMLKSENLRLANLVVEIQNKFTDNLKAISSQEYKTAVRKRNKCLDQILKIEESEKYKNKLIWITINPKPDVVLFDFKLKLEKAMTKKWITEAYYTYEQRGDNELTMGMGIHAHILILNNKRKSEVHREFFNTFKMLVGNKNHVMVQEFPGIFKDDKIKYLQGEKFTPEKNNKSQIDKLWRKRENLEDLYKINI